MINFKNINIEGFTSIVEPSTFELDRGDSLNIIRGKVGAGKTTIPNALTWALFGQTLKVKSSIEPWEELRGENYRGTKVTVEFEKDGLTYQVIRCKNFKGNITVGKKVKMKGSSNTILLLEGALIEGKGKVNTQQNINKVLGYSFELFKNSIVFGQKMKRIIEETGPEKKKIFDEAFEVGFIEKAKDNTNSERQKLIGLRKDIEHNIEIVDERLSKYQSNLEFALENESNFDINKNERLKEYSDNIKETKAELKELKKENIKVIDINTLELTKKHIEKELNKSTISNDNFFKLERNITNIQSDISYHEQQRKLGFESCPTCGGKLNKAKASEMNDDSLSKIRKLEKTLFVLKKEYMAIEHIDISKLKRQVEKINDQISEAKANNRYAETYENRLTKLNNRIKSYEEKIDEINDRKLKIKSTLYEKLRNKLINESRKLNKQQRRINKEIEIKDWLINDPLSNNGLKAYIFDSLLNNVNEKLNNYEPILGFQVEFGIDLKSHRKDFYQLIMKEGILISYEDLSGGQQQLVNTAVAFAIHDVISQLRPMNIIFLDEPFESLDVDTIEVVSELVYEKSKDKSLYLITHHQSFSPTNANEIYITNIDGKTQID